MFIRLLKRTLLVGGLLFSAICSLYIHASIHTDYIPDKYNAYALVYGDLSKSRDSDKEEPLNEQPEEEPKDILDSLENFTP